MALRAGARAAARPAPPSLLLPTEAVTRAARAAAELAELAAVQGEGVHTAMACMYTAMEKLPLLAGG